VFAGPSVRPSVRIHTPKRGFHEKLSFKFDIGNVYESYFIDNNLIHNFYINYIKLSSYYLYYDARPTKSQDVYESVERIQIWSKSGEKNVWHFT